MSEKIQFSAETLSSHMPASSRVRGMPIATDEVAREPSDQLEAFVVATRKFENLVAAERKKVSELIGRVKQLETENELAVRSLEETTKALQNERSMAEGRKNNSETRLADMQKKLAGMQGQAEAYWKKINQQTCLIESQSKELETYKKAWAEMQENGARREQAAAKSEEENRVLRSQVAALSEAHKDLAVELERERTLRVQLQFHQSHQTKIASDLPEIRSLFSALNNRMGDIQKLLEQQVSGVVPLGDDSHLVRIHRYLENTAQAINGIQQTQKEEAETLSKGLPTEIGKLQAGMQELSADIKKLQTDKKMAVDAQRARSAHAMRDLLTVKESEIASLRTKLRKMTAASEEYDRVHAVLESLVAQRDEIKALMKESERRAAEEAKNS